MTTQQKEGFLSASRFETPIGEMIAIGNEDALYLLEFVDCRGFERELERLQQKTKWAILPGISKTTQSIESELEKYFEGKLTSFQTPLSLLGTSFQNRVWRELSKIPHSETRSYAEIALALDKPTAYRAVAQANGANQLAIVIPCHRVINSDGKLGGYAGGLTRKQWLLNHELIHHKYYMV